MKLSIQSQLTTEKEQRSCFVVSHFEVKVNLNGSLPVSTVVNSASKSSLKHFLASTQLSLSKGYVCVFACVVIRISLPESLTDKEWRWIWPSPPPPSNNVY